MREIIWALIAALFAYVVFQVWRALKVGPAKPPQTAPPGAPPEPAGAGRASDDAASVGDDEVFVFEPALRAQTAAGVAAGGDAGLRDLPSTAPPADAFQLELEVRQLRRDVVQLRGELADQRREAERLGAEQRALKDQMESTLASHGISPEYNEALVFARRGMDVGTIAERCGISVAEAELVHSLARGTTSDTGSGSGQ
nr:DUF2802 domain-containing protein [Zoogloeaceae bacterium]